MKYKNLVIKCKNVEELIKLQKHLFEYKYAWFDNSCRNRSLKKIEDTSYVTIQNDDILRLNIIGVGNPPFKTIDYISFEKKFERRLKLKKINNA